VLASDHAVRDCEIVERRITEASPRGDHWNDWPDELDVVTIDELDCNDPHQAYRYAYILGTAMGGSGKMRQVDSKLLPVEVRTAVARRRPHGRLYHLEAVHFLLATGSGQVDDPQTRNLLALIDPERGYDIKEHRSTFDTPAFVIELGCSHNYRGEHPYGVNRGYYTAECVKCGHKYEVDSGD
jgi:hypothetical protein